MVIRPGEGRYNEALAEWESEQHPDRDEVVSTASGRKQAMAVVQAVAEDPVHVAEAVDALDDPVAAAEALGDPIPPHIVTRIIGEVLAEIDARSV